MPTRTCEKAGGGEKGREGKGRGRRRVRVICVTTRGAARISRRPPASLSGALLAECWAESGSRPFPPPLPPTLDFQRYLPIFLLLSAPLWRVPLASFIETGSRSRDLASLSNLVFFHHRESCTIFFFFFFFLFTRFFPHTFVSWRACSRGEFLETVFKV